MNTTSRKVVCAVLPCYRVADNVSRVINDLLPHVDMIVAVNDGSPDTTKQVLLNSPCVYLEHIVNRGQGAALATGTRYALSHGADIIIHFDSDGQHQPTDIAQLIEPIVRGEADVVLGSRFLPGATTSQIPWSKRHLVLPIAKIINFLFTGLWLTDTHNGLRALSADAARKIRIAQDRMAHATEITEEVAIHRLKYTERPVNILYPEYGQGIAGGLKIIKELIIAKIVH